MRNFSPALHSRAVLLRFILRFKTNNNNVYFGGWNRVHSLLLYSLLVLPFVFWFFFALSGFQPSSTITAWLSSAQDRASSILGRPNNYYEATANAITYTPSPISPAPAQPWDIWIKPIWEVPTSGMPNMSFFKLTKEMVMHRSKNNVIIMTFGNYALLDFMVNWVKHLTDKDVHNLLVGAMDKSALEALYWKGIPVFDMDCRLSTEDAGWGTPLFHKMGQQKALLTNEVLNFGFELLMCDADVVWLKNPLPYFARYHEADVLVSSDQINPTVTDGGLEMLSKPKGNLNIGIVYWRPTIASINLAKQWKDELANGTSWDQGAFNYLMFAPDMPDEGDGRLFNAFYGSVKLGILPSSLFCSGHTYFVQSTPQLLRLDPYSAHTTFQYKGTHGKRHRFRERMLFYDYPEYYDSLGGFLSFKPKIPKRLLRDGLHTIESHFSLVNYQMKNIRTAFAITMLLNRTLILPPLWCRLDMLSGWPSGVYPNSVTRQPFLCPLDHVFDVNIMQKELPEAHYGPKLDFREYSFLQNPRLPRQVRDSLLKVQLCDKQSPKCNVKDSPHKGTLRFPKNSSEYEFKQVFSKYMGVKVLEFSSMVDAFQGFTDEVTRLKFRDRMRLYVAQWCCLKDNEVGHIYYDMYWDEKPGWKPDVAKHEQEDSLPL